MNERRYQIFISSTFRDLVSERQAVLLSVQRLNHIPAGMELFPSANDAPWDVIQRIIEASDYYVLIIGGRYGSTASDGISFTEREYDLAHSLGIPILEFLHEEPGKLPADQCEMDASARHKLDEFRVKVEASHHCTYWRTADELAAKMVVAIVNEIARNPKPGWVRGNLADDLEQLLATLEHVRKRNDQLETKLQEVRAASADRIEELEQGSDSVELEIDKEYRDKVKSTLIKTTWQDVFNAIGYMVSSGLREDQLGYAIGPAFFRGSSYVRLTNNATKLIRNQFVALGLMDVESQIFTASNSRGPYSIQRAVWKLTEQGKRLYAMSQAAKRGGNEDTVA